MEFEYPIGFDWGPALADTQAALNQLENMFLSFHTQPIGSRGQIGVPTTGPLTDVLHGNRVDFRDEAGVQRAAENLKRMGDDLRRVVDPSNPQQQQMLTKVDNEARALAEAAQAMRAVAAQFRGNPAGPGLVREVGSSLVPHTQDEANRVIARAGDDAAEQARIRGRQEELLLARRQQADAAQAKFEQAAADARTQEEETRRRALAKLGIADPALTDPVIAAREQRRQTMAAGGADDGGRAGGGGGTPPDDPDDKWSAEKVAARRRLKAERELEVSRLMEEGAAFGDIPGKEGINRARNQVQNARREMAEQEFLDSDDVREDYVRNVAESAAAERRRTAAIERATAESLSRAGNEEIAGAIVARQVRSLQEQLAVMRETQDMEEKGLADTKRIIGLKAQMAVEQQRIQHLQRDANLAAFRAAGLDQQGTTFQRLQSRLHTRQTGEVRSPLQEATLGQYASQRLIQSASFAASGALLYGGLQAITSIVNEAEELEKVLNQVEAQFESADEAAEFPRFKAAMLDIARVTGQSTSEVAFVGFQMKGAFDDTTDAIQATTDAITVARVTGLELSEVVDSLTGASSTYGRTIEDIGDVALGVQERFGVIAKESITFMADLAPVAAEAGLELEQLGVLAGISQKYSGRSGAVLAEAYGRIIPSISNVGIQIAQVYEQAGMQQEAIATAQQLGQGNTGAILLGLVENWNQLGEAQRNNIITLLGGRREAQALIPILEHSGEVMRGLAESTEDAGKTQEYFTKLQQTLSQALARARAEFQQLGEALFRAGLGDLLRDMALAGGAALSILRHLLEVFAFLNESTGGWAIRLLEVIAVLKTLQVVGRFVDARSIAGGVRGMAGAAIGGVVGFGGNLRAAGQLGREEYQTRRAMGQNVLTSANRGAAGGLSALGISPGGIITASAIAVGATYVQQRMNVDQASKGLRRQMEEADEEKLKELAKRRGDFWEQVTLFATGNPQVDEMARDILADREATTATQNLGEARRLGIDVDERRRRQLVDQYKSLPGGNQEDNELADAFAEQGITGDAFAQILKDAANGDTQMLELLQILDRSYRGTGAGDARAEYLAAMEALQQSLADRERYGVAKEAITPGAEGEASQVIQTLESSQQLFQAGEITAAQHLETLRSSLSLYKVAAQSGPLDAARLAEMNKITKQINEVESKQAVEALEFYSELRQSSGTYTPRQRFDDLTRLLPRITDPRQRAVVAGKIVAAQGDLYEWMIENAADTAAAVSLIRNGMPGDPEAQLAQAERLLRELDLGWSTFFLTTRTSLFMQADSVKQIVDKANEIGGGMRAGAIALIDEQIAEFEAWYAQYGSPGDEYELQNLREARADLAGLEDYTPTGGQQKTPEDAAREAAALERDLALAKIDRERSRIEGDPVAEADQAIASANAAMAYAQALPVSPEKERALIAAEAEMNRAQRQRTDALIDVQNAQAEAVAQASGDPVAIAQARLAAADRAAANARGAAAQWRAQIERVEAQRQLSDAVNDVLLAQTEFAMAVADAAGDSVRVAEIQLENAIKEQARVKQLTPNDQAAIERANAEVVRNEANLAQVRFNDATENIEFQREMEQISVGQAIAMYEALLAAETNEDRRRELMRTIKSLRDEIGADMMWNIPQEIAPTLYEARRFSQLEGGSGYQDNRNISVTLEINNGMDEERAKEFLADTFGTSARVFGSSGRVY